MSDPRQDFVGAKLLLFLGEVLVVLRRDHAPGIDWPGGLDFPGGGRETGETPEACVLRETREEVGLALDHAALRFVRLREGPRGVNWFFAAHLPGAAREDVVFGGEGAGWLLMPPAAYIADPRAIPPFRRILADYLRDGMPP